MDTKKMAIIATKGTLDWAYPPFILASTAAALGYETQIFFTFYGLQLVRKDLSGLKVSPLGQPRHADEDALWPQVVQEHQLEHAQRHSVAYPRL